MTGSRTERITTSIGKTFQADRTITTDGAVLKDPTLAAAKEGRLTTRTDNDTGELTMDAGHGITDGNRLDVYWDDPTTGESKCRYGMTVGTVATNQVPIDGGAGDNLPVDETDITAMVPQSEAFVVTAANAAFIGVQCASPATAVFMSVVPATVAAGRVTYLADYVWDSANGVTTPFGADVVTVYLSHGSSAGSRQVTALVGSN